MKVLPIQNNFSIQSNNQNCKPRQMAFRGQLLTNTLRGIEYPQSVSEWHNSFVNLLNIAKNEPKFKVTDLKIFNDLCKKSKSIGEFDSFIDQRIKDSLENGEAFILAYDDKIPSIVLKKDFRFASPRNFVQIGDGDKYSQFGITDIYEGMSPKFYNDNDGYVDYHQTGEIRKFKPVLGDAKYFKTDGSRDFFGGLKEIINHF